MLGAEFKYFISNLDEMVTRYNGKIIVIVSEDVVGVYDTFEDALFESQKKYRPGSFFIEKVLPGKNNYIQRFHSRVTF